MSVVETSFRSLSCGRDWRGYVVDGSGPRSGERGVHGDRKPDQIVWRRRRRRTGTAKNDIDACGTSGCVVSPPGRILRPRLSLPRDRRLDRLFPFCFNVLRHRDLPSTHQLHETIRTALFQRGIYRLFDRAFGSTANGPPRYGCCCSRASRACSWTRARRRRDATVPVGMPRIAAVSRAPSRSMA